MRKLAEAIFRAFAVSGELALKLCAAVALFGIMALMVVDVTGRYVFNRPVGGAAEIIELAMGVVVFSALPLVTGRGEHVTLDYFESLFQGTGRAVVRTLADLATVAILGFLSWRIAIKAANHLSYGDTTPFLRAPVGPVAMFLAACTALAAVVLLVISIRRILGTRHGEQA